MGVLRGALTRAGRHSHDLAERAAEPLGKWSAGVRGARAVPGVRAFPRGTLATAERVFYSMQVAGSERDRVTLAQIAGTAARHARRTTLSADQEQAAVGELIEAAAGRGDLLAQYAGLTVGFHEGDYDEALYLRAAQLCIEAGADSSLIPQWIDEGRRRASVVRAERRALTPA
jgi:hypothetical protein